MKFCDRKRLCISLGSSGQQKVLKQSVQNLFHTNVSTFCYQLYIFGVGLYGQRYTWPDHSSSGSVFQSYEPSLRYWVGSSLPTTDLQNNCVDVLRWVLTKPAYGTQEFLLDDEHMDAVEGFRLCDQIRREYMYRDVEQGLQM